MALPTITFACLNNVAYTAQLLASLSSAGIDPAQIVAVDNASTDETFDTLLRASVHVIRNKRNLGCGVAWNQGILLHQSDWTVVMNNDVIVDKNWLENLIKGAEQSNLLIASPAMIEGPLSYDFNQLAETQSQLMQGHIRAQTAHAVCMAVHDEVFKRIGYFHPNPSLLGFEDTLFFHAAHKAEIPMGVVGDSWIHHFGSITQKWLKEERGIPAHQGLGNKRNKYLLNESWFERKFRQHRKRRLLRAARSLETSRFGSTVHGLVQENSTIKWI
jgi:GT2 family glycosyltransferase